MIFNHSIINAAKAAERSESVSRNFHDLGIEPNFFEAIMGNELNETQLKGNAAGITVFLLLEKLGAFYPI